MEEINDSKHKVVLLPEDPRKTLQVQLHQTKMKDFEAKAWELQGGGWLKHHWRRIEGCRSISFP